MKKEKGFQLGDLVWAKMRGYPSWPAMIVNPPRNVPAIPFKKYVIFFGDCERAWMAEKQFMSFEKNYEKFSKIKKAKFQVALQAVEKFNTFFLKLEDSSKTKKTNLEVRKKMLKKYSSISRKDMEQITLMKRKIKKEADAVIKEERLDTHSHLGLTSGHVANDDAILNKVVKEEENATTNDESNISERKCESSKEHAALPNEGILQDTNDDQLVPMQCDSTKVSHNDKDSEEKFLPAFNRPSTSRETFGFEYESAQRSFLERLDLCNAASQDKKNLKASKFNDSLQQNRRKIVPSIQNKNLKASKKRIQGNTQNRGKKDSPSIHKPKKSTRSNLTNLKRVCNIKKETIDIEKEEGLNTHSHLGLTSGHVANNDAILNKAVKKEKNATTYNESNIAERKFESSKEHAALRNKGILQDANDDQHVPMQCDSTKVLHNDKDSEEKFLPAVNRPSTSRETFGFEYEDEEILRDNFEDHPVPTPCMSSKAAHQYMKDDSKEIFLPAGDGPSTSKEMFGKEYINKKNLKASKLNDSVQGYTQNQKKNVASSVEKPKKSSKKPTVFDKDCLDKKKMKASMFNDSFQQNRRKIVPSIETPKRFSKKPILLNKDCDKNLKASKKRIQGNAQNRGKIDSPSIHKPKKSTRSNLTNLKRVCTVKATQDKSAEQKKGESRSVDASSNEETPTGTNDSRHFVPIDSSDVPPEIKRPEVFPRYHLLQVLHSYYWKTFWGTDYSPK